MKVPFPNCESPDEVQRNFEFLLARWPTSFDDGSRIWGGPGTPEGVVTAAPGAVFLRSNGGAGTTFYVKESGTGNTGWVGK